MFEISNSHTGEVYAIVSGGDVLRWVDAFYSPCHISFSIRPID